jgi:hypothetical protein
MTSYRVDFMNNFARNRRVHKVCQRSIVVRSAVPNRRAKQQKRISLGSRAFATGGFMLRRSKWCRSKLIGFPIQMGLPRICYRAENQRFRGRENAEKLCSGTVGNCRHWLSMG